MMTRCSMLRVLFYCCAQRAGRDLREAWTVESAELLQQNDLNDIICGNSSSEVARRRGTSLPREGSWPDLYWQCYEGWGIFRCNKRGERIVVWKFRENALGKMLAKIEIGWLLRLLISGEIGKEYRELFEGILWRLLLMMGSLLTWLLAKLIKSDNWDKLVVRNCNWWIINKFFQS